MYAHSCTPSCLAPQRVHYLHPNDHKHDFVRCLLFGICPVRSGAVTVNTQDAYSAGGIEQRQRRYQMSHICRTGVSESVVTVEGPKGECVLDFSSNTIEPSWYFSTQKY